MPLLRVIFGFTVLPIICAAFFTLLNWFISLIFNKYTFESIQYSEIWIIWIPCIFIIIVAYYFYGDEEDWFE